MDKTLKKLFVFLIKYIPVIQMAGILFNNLLCGIENIYIDKLLDFTFGNSLSCILILYICSYTFNFCAWHRLVISANLINITIVFLDRILQFNTTNFQQILLFFTIDIIFIMLILINKFKCKK